MKRQRFVALGGCLLVLLIAFQPLPASAYSRVGNPVAQQTGPIQPISIISSELAGGGSYASISADGRYIVFESPFSGFSAVHLRDSWDTYVKDRQTNQTILASVRSGGAPAYNNGEYTSRPVISGNGQYVAFMSQASDLIGSDANSAGDIFVRDLIHNTTELISVTPDGKSGNDASYTPAISADGRYVAFQSFACDLTAGDTNNSMDVFIRDRQLGITEIVSVGESGQQGSDMHDYGFPGLSISDDGRYVTFAYSSLPVKGFSSDVSSGVFLRDRQNHTTEFVASGSLPTISPDGRYLAFVSSAALVSSDTNQGADVYLLDRQANQLERISTTPNAPEAVDALITDPPSLSADGRYVAFETTTDLLLRNTNGIANVYLRDRQTGQSGTTILVSNGVDGAPANGETHFPALSSDGKSLAFTSMATNLINSGSNGQNNIYVTTITEPPTNFINGAGVIIYLPMFFKK